MAVYGRLAIAKQPVVELLKLQRTIILIKLEAGDWALEAWANSGFDTNIAAN